jgi:hypothetical protein
LKNRSKVNWENYRKQRNHVNKVKKKSIQNYFFERCVGGPKSSDFWPTRAYRFKIYIISNQLIFFDHTYTRMLFIYNNICITNIFCYVEPITFFINKCIDVSIFPDKLKTAQVRPLFKKKNILEKGNYRPVSVLPTISTFVERAIFDQLTDFFKQYKA